MTTITPIEESIEKRFGVLPNFFRLASVDPEITANLWGFAQFGYLNNPLPSLFKERLFVYLSRFCEVRYCIARHLCFLVGLGHPAGDADCTPQTVEAVLPLLRRPLPHGVEMDVVLSTCASFQIPLASLPAPDTVDEQALFACATHAFLQTPHAASAQLALRRVLGERLAEHLSVFLAFVRMAHYWTRLHPELVFEDDIKRLLAAHEAIAECVLNDPLARPDRLSQQIAVELASLRDLQQRHEKLTFAYQELHDERDHANDRLAQKEAQLREVIAISAQQLPGHLAAIVESSDDAIISQNLDGVILSWNRSAERIFGYTAEEAIGKQISLLAAPDRIDEMPKILERISRGERVDHYQTKGKTRDGRILDVSLAVSPIRDATGRIVAASKIARDITQQLRYELSAREASQQRLLLERIFVAQEEERRRIALDLHDEAGQLLTALLVGLKTAESSKSLAQSKAIARQMREIGTLALDELRRLAHGLHPAALSDHGLCAAISAYITEYSMRHDIRVRLTDNGVDLTMLPDSAQIVLYRIVQEALTNVARHAHARTADITWKRSSDILEMSVVDDGCGFDVNEMAEFTKNRLGLQSIRERAALLGGVATVTSGNAGTRVQVEIPSSVRRTPASL